MLKKLSQQFDVDAFGHEVAINILTWTVLTSLASLSQYCHLVRGGAISQESCDRGKEGGCSVRSVDCRAYLIESVLVYL